ncbi:hypothetical protein F8388_023865, partial [Cannabis sativa]
PNPFFPNSSLSPHFRSDHSLPRHSNHCSPQTHDLGGSTNANYLHLFSRTFLLPPLRQIPLLGFSVTTVLTGLTIKELRAREH